MMGTRARPLLAAMLLVCAAACGRPTPPPLAPAPAPAAKPPPKEPGGGMKKMKQVQIVVGGCSTDCAEPGLAVTRFMEATADLTGHRLAALYLDSTTLVLDGERLGERWVRMWRELRQATRKEDIRETAKALSGWTRGLTPDQVRDSLTSGLKPVKVWTTEAVYRFQAPGLSWRIVLRPRGLEWLVVELERTGDESGSSDEP